jgi:hypothetical protein
LSSTWEKREIVGSKEFIRFLKHLKTQISLVVHAYNPSYSEHRGRRILVGGYLDKSSKSGRAYMKSKLRAKGLGLWLKW